MNTGSRDEQEYLHNHRSIAKSLKSIAESLRILADSHEDDPDRTKDLEGEQT